MPMKKGGTGKQAPPKKYQTLVARKDKTSDIKQGKMPVKAGGGKAGSGGGRAMVDKPGQKRKK